MNNARYNAPCAFWPTRSLHPTDVANSAVPPVLLFQGHDDAATSYEGGAVVHRLLRGSSLVVEQGGGNHGITLSGNARLDPVPVGPSGVRRRRAAVARSTRSAPSCPTRKPLTTKASTGPSDGTELHGLLGYRLIPRAVRGWVRMTA